MAKIVHLTTRHDCRDELAREINPTDVWLGTVVECSCGKRFIWSDDQRDGPYWADHVPGTTVVSS